MHFIKQSIIFFFKGLFSLLVLLIIASTIIIALKIQVNLSPLNKPIEIAVEKLLDRDFSMNGDVILIPTLWPTLEIHDVSIANPEGLQWKTGKELAHLGKLRLQLGIIPLLSGEIHVADITAQEVTLNLENNTKGISNWDFNIPSKPAKNKTALQASTAKSNSIFHFESLDNIVFHNINIHYLDQAINKPIHFNLQKLRGNASPEKEINLQFNGKLQDKEYSMILKGGGLDNFRDKSTAWPVDMKLKIAGTDIKITGTLHRGEIPKLSASLEIGKTDIGATLSWFKIIKGLQMGSEQLNVSADVQGNTLSEIIKSSQLSIILKDAWWNISDKNTGTKLPIKITQGTMTISPQKPVQLNLDGILDLANINILVTGAPIIDYLSEDAITPLVLDIKSHNTNLTLSTSISHAMDVDNLGFNMVFKGNKLNDLNELIKMDLPPLGPYRLEGYFGTKPQGYQIKNLVLTLKESQLKGNMLFNTKAKPPILNIDLSSQLVQINNFDTGDWSAVEEKPEKTIATKDKKHKNLDKNKKKARKLLSHETLSRFDINIKLAIEKVLSGEDNLGKGTASISLEKARLNLNLAELILPGGHAQADFVYHPSGQNHIDIALQLLINHFDYGIMARRIDPKSKVGGFISLNVDLSSNNATNVNSLLVNSKGHVDFSLSPKELDADLFEMWAVNVISSILKDADKSESSQVNCVIARLVFDQGIMKQKAIYADTTKMIMTGTAEANFKERTIAVNVAPTAKKPEFFSLATPVGIKGTFDDFGLTISPLGLTKTSVSFITSPLHVPIRRLFKDGIPADGQTACKTIWETPEEVE